MTPRRLAVLSAFAAAGLAAALFPCEPAAAARKPYENKQLGYRLMIDDRFVQTPPQLTSEMAFLVGDWYEDSAKYDRGLKPTFQVMWFVEPRDAKPAAPAVTPGATPPAPVPEGGPVSKPPAPGGADEDGEKDGEGGPKRPRIRDQDQAVDMMLGFNTHLFGAKTPMKERWTQAKTDKTKGRIPFEYVEVNPPTKKKDRGGPPGYALVARLKLERVKETIHVGFFASCAADAVKDMRGDFIDIVQSFEELKAASDSRNEGAQADLSDDRNARYEQIVKTKVIKGWKAERTEQDNYILLYDQEVDPKLIRKIGAQIEAIRAQVYEVLFPPERPVTAFSIVRVCRDRDAYIQYGGSPSAAGHWNWHAEELVFFEDKPPEDSLRVLYHEAFHQYIHYSVGEVHPHSWFNEGYGDYFAGHDYRPGGKFVRGPFSWRINGAKEWKRSEKRPPLRDWLKWSQAQYYGANEPQIPGGANYALGWSFVYFLRTTKNEAYQQILPRYFEGMKAGRARERVLDEAFKKKLDDWKAKSEADPEKAGPRPERQKDDYAEEPMLRALREAFEGIDMDQLEKDWLAADY